MSTLTIVGVEGLGEITSGTDLAVEIAARAALHDGDVVVVTSKVVSKAAGLVVRGERAELVDEHTERVVARRGATRIVRTASGLTLAAAGLDASNTEPGTVVLLPQDADESAAAIRAGLAHACGVNVAVVVTDTAGRAWRAGQTDIAIGVAGMRPVLDLAGRGDSHGVALEVTAPAIADELAGAADLVQGKLSRIPVAVVSGLAGQVLAADDHGPGAVALLRPASEDLFGWGAADAVRVAVRRDDHDRFDGFPAPDTDAAGLVRDAAAAIAPHTLDIDSAGADSWGARVVEGCDALTAAWAAGALVERLQTLAVATSHWVEIDRDAAHPYVVRWSLHPRPTVGAGS